MTIRSISAILGAGAALYLVAAGPPRPGPASPYYWAAIADASPEPGPAIGFALERGPALPSIQFRAANRRFIEGDPAAALAMLRRVLQSTDQWDRQVFATAVRLAPDTGAILEHAIGGRREGEAFLRFLLNEGMLDDAHVVWKHLSQRGLAGTGLADLYANTLIDARMWETAAEVRGSKDLLLDPGFEAPLGERGFRWIAAKQPVVRDTETHRSGSASVRLGGSVFQRMVLRGVSYTLSGWTRGGPVHVRMFDEANPSGASAAIRGDSKSEWTRFSVSFQGKLGAKLVQVRIDSAGGEAWLDDFAVEENHL